MRTIPLFLVSLFFSISAFAQSSITFDPPDPTSRTPVYAHIRTITSQCAVASTNVARNGRLISVTLITDPVCYEIPTLHPLDTTVDLGATPPGIYDVVVSRDALLLALAEATLTVKENAPAFEVRPNTITTSETIRIAGNALTICNPTCDAVVVRFGDQAANVVSVSANEVSVIPPALGPGTYDVTVSHGGISRTSTAAFRVERFGETKPDRAFYERILFPVFLGGPGSFGAQWRTDASLHNGASFPWAPSNGSIFLVGCFPICDFRPQANADVTITSSDGGTPAGLVEWAPRQAAALADFGLIVRNVSISTTDLGTEVPVVREKDLFARPFSLLNVPTSPQSRITLRIFDVEGTRRINLRIYAVHRNRNSELFVDQSFVLPAQSSLLGGAMWVANDLLAVFPTLANQGPLRIEIAPESPSDIRSLWGFVSVTNNETQHVTVISPN
ncbi:MAG: hypothetical protein QOI24_850 [Acidobacteriota bacterium]|jgi:hypothetical protein|nr:hypothetical protein [Acidobacteriota bacterium]